MAKRTIYLPHEIETMDPGEIRKAYSRLRKQANRRLANLEKNDLGGYGSFRYGRLDQMFDDDVAQELAEVSRFLRDPRHTVRGAKQWRSEMLESLHENKGGVFDDINESNFQDWVEYMDHLRDKYGNKLFDSGDATEVFIEAERLNLPDTIIRNHFNMFRKNLDTIRDIDSITNAKKPGATVRFTDFKNAIKKAKR